MQSTQKLASVTTAAYVEIRPLTDCFRVVIKEDRAKAGYPTTDFLYRGPSSAEADADRYFAGERLILIENSTFYAGRLYGYYKTVGATTDFLQTEDTE